MEETGNQLPEPRFKLPAGFSFNPSDHDVICYLECKAMEEESPCEGAIIDADLYGDKEPWEIFEEFELEKSSYFFTRFKENVRKIGVNGGVWKATGDDQTKAKKVIYNEFKKEIGRSREFVYSNDDVQQNDYKWLMEEYVLSGDTLTDPKLKHSDYAVCFIRKKDANDDCDDDAYDNSDNDYIYNNDDDNDSDLEDAIDRTVYSVQAPLNPRVQSSI